MSDSTTYFFMGMARRSGPAAMYITTPKDLGLVPRTDVTVALRVVSTGRTVLITTRLVRIGNSVKFLVPARIKDVIHADELLQVGMRIGLCPPDDLVWNYDGEVGIPASECPDASSFVRASETETPEEVQDGDARRRDKGRHLQIPAHPGSGPVVLSCPGRGLRTPGGARYRLLLPRQMGRTGGQDPYGQGQRIPDPMPGGCDVRRRRLRGGPQRR